MGFVDNYAPCGFSPQTDGMPVILRNVRRRAHIIKKPCMSFDTHRSFVHIRIIDSYTQPLPVENASISSATRLPDFLILGAFQGAFPLVPNILSVLCVWPAHYAHMSYHLEL